MIIVIILSSTKCINLHDRNGTSLLAKVRAWNRMEHNLVTVEWWSDLRQFFDRFSPRMSTVNMSSHFRESTYLLSFLSDVLSHRRTSTQDFPSYAQWLGHLRSNVCVSTEKKKNKQTNETKECQKYGIAFSFLTDSVHGSQCCMDVPHSFCSLRRFPILTLEVEPLKIPSTPLKQRTPPQNVLLTLPPPSP